MGQIASNAEARAAIDSGVAKVAFIVPPDFSRNQDAGKPAYVQMMVDGSDPNTASTALFTATAIAQAQGRIAGAGEAGPGGHQPERSRCRSRCGQTSCTTPACRA